MRTGVALVAIPPKDDYVWKLSSEKVPHMTLLYFGDQPDDFPSVRALKYLEHAVNTVMFRFGADVIRRGELGPDPSDVLFFSKWSTKQVDEFRSLILKDPEFFAAHQSAPQFPEWTPHLTLGNPDAPAKPDKRDWAGTTWVKFDSIALWTGNFEGPEFPLKAEGDELRMSDKIDEFLEHFGVRGMHWGVRRVRNRIANRPDHSSDDAKAAKVTKKKLRKHGTKALSNEELQALVKRMNLEAQLSDLKKKQPTTFNKGHETVKTILKVAKTGQQISELASGPLGKAGFSAVKSALKL